MRLDYFGRMAYQHWKNNLPGWFNELQRTGRLEEVLMKASQGHRGMVMTLIESGFALREAEKIALPQFIMLSPEEAVLIG
jgi:hypothetical protein